MRWPLPSAPYNDEILNSYLAHAAFRHRLSAAVFAAQWWPYQAVWNRDLDRDENPAWLTDLAGRSGLTLEKLQAMTLDAPRRRFGRGSGDTPLILSDGIYHRARVQHAVQICSRGLGDGEPYLQPQAHCPADATGRSRRGGPVPETPQNRRRHVNPHGSAAENSYEHSPGATRIEPVHLPHPTVLP